MPLSPTLRLRRIARCALGAALLAPAWSQASAASCDGKHATIVGTAGDDRWSARGPAT